MLKCGQCGGKLRRVHRSFSERFSYMAIYACRDCKHEEQVVRRYRFHLGRYARCPRCGTFRIVRLKGRDKIDPMYSGMLNFMEKLAGGALHHCRFCRIQFFDRRQLASAEAVPQVVITPQDTAKTDA